MRIGARREFGLEALVGLAIVQSGDADQASAGVRGFVGFGAFGAASQLACLNCASICGSLR